MTAKQSIPVESWVRIQVGEDVVVAFTYLDRAAGLSARGGLLADSATADEARRVAGQPDRTVRLRSGAFAVEALDEATIRALGLPPHPPWHEPRAASPWRGDTTLHAARHPDLPDDVQTRFLWPAIKKVEDMWVRLDGVDESLATTRPVYAGELLNQSHYRQDFQAGTRVSVVSLPGGGALFASAELRQNATQWLCACQGCGFDLHPIPMDDIVAAQFGEAGEAYAMVELTTRCVACRGTMLVSRRAEASDASSGTTV